ncbi:hypothetical protein SESBI_01178 [Sesbania bispinosa]|nr:hypothetical protein SESBI_01178 [Sesbania bispinosa]
MVTRRNTGRADGHAGNGGDASETTPETDNSVLQRILRSMDQLQEQNQTLQEQNQTLQTQVTTLAKGRAEEDISEGDTGEFHPSRPDLVLTLASSFHIRHIKSAEEILGPILSPKVKDDDFGTDYSESRQGTRAHLSTTYTGKKGYDSRGRNFQTRISWDDHRRPDPVSNYGVDTLIPLNTTRARILKEVYQSDLIRLPPQAEGPKGPDISKWCDYHRAKGRDTEDYWTLMNRIEKLIKEGYLGRYIEKRKGRGDKDQRRDEEGTGSKRCRDDRHKETRGKEEVEGVVTTIAGGFTGGGETSSARRRYARQVMTIQTDLFEQGNNHTVIAFTNEDLRGIQPHQDDPMVIDVLMAKYRVQRVLIDQGSSADVLY